MSDITLEQAEAILGALVQAQIADPIGALGTVSINGTSITYKSASELIRSVNYWRSEVQRLKRTAAGGPRQSFAVADFRGRR